MSDRLSLSEVAALDAAAICIVLIFCVLFLIAG
jgi:hypothetical protein